MNTHENPNYLTNQKDLTPGWQDDEWRIWLRSGDVHKTPHSVDLYADAHARLARLQQRQRRDELCRFALGCVLAVVAGLVMFKLAVDIYFRLCQ